jgi:lipoprotein signal peptidase
MPAYTTAFRRNLTDVGVFIVFVGFDQTVKHIFFDQSHVLNTGSVFGIGRGFSWDLVLPLLFVYLVYVWWNQRVGCG